MASRIRAADLLRQLDPGAVADADLVGRFVASRDQAAFAELVRRHGPTVLAVCRRVTGHPQDAEDAFQAAFLTLARKAGAVQNPDLVGNWLYGVAVRVSWRSRRSARRRQRREVPAVNAPEPVARDATPFETGPELYEELDRLPAWYRDAILLCDLRGVSRAEAAKRLGIPEGTLSSRLAGGRKRLADRLARRGVALSAATVPAVLGEGRGGAAVPDDLVTKTCGLVADWAAGGVVPGSVAWLADGGLSMRQVFLAGAFGLALASAGLVAAGGRVDDPPKLTDDRPKPADKPAAKVEPKPDTGEPVALGTPRLTKAIDLDLPAPRELAFSPTGPDVAVRVSHPQTNKGDQFGAAPGRQGENWVYAGPPEAVNSGLGQFPLSAAARLVRFTPDGQELITDLREFELVSGRHHLIYWRRKADGSFSDGRKVDLDPDPTTGYAFSADGKTFRTVYRESTVGQPGRVEVREVSTETGRTLKTLLATEAAFGAVALSADGKRLAGFGAEDRVTVYDVDTGKQLWSRVVDLKQLNKNPNRIPQPSGLDLSPDGSRLLVFHGLGVPALLDAATGEVAVELEGTSFVQVLPHLRGFSADGRLYAASGMRTIRHEQPDPKADGKFGRPQVTFSDGGKFLTVWDTRTGKAVKSWKGVWDVAFHPTKPVLAILEPNGDKTRLGLWDFAAGVPEKK